MSLENLKSRTDLTLNEINQLLDNEKDVNVFKKLLYFKFKEMGFSKIKSCELAGFPRKERMYISIVKTNIGIIQTLRSSLELVNTLIKIT